MTRPDWPSVGSITAAFGLSGAAGELEPVRGAWSNRVFRLRVGHTTVAVKEMIDGWKQPGWFDRVDEAWVFELAAFGAGVPAPEPVPNPVDGGWRAEVERCVGDAPATVRLHHWVDADVVPDGVASVELAEWSGSVLARLHGLDVQPRRPDLFPPWSTESADRWPELVEEAVAAGVEWAGLARRASPAVSTIRAMALDAPGAAGTVMSHRDIDQKNVLLGASGPLLCDWDVAGPVVPREELIDVALSMARWESPSVARAVIGAYRRAGGDDSELRPTDLAPMLLSSVLWLVINAERALGLRDAGPEELERGTQLVPGLLERLPRRLAMADGITDWLAGPG
jgi:Ser/Thr protein kinase RdoA (MazF antagonist)